jgi:DNA polymerase alpha-associated DNA helicase A
MELTRRNGDPVRIEPHITVNPKGKGKKKEDDEGTVEGVIYRVSVPRYLEASASARIWLKVSAEKVIVAVDESKEIDLPERLRLYVLNKRSSWC